MADENGNTEELKKLPPDERIKRLKKIEEDRKKKEAEEKKLLQEAQEEIVVTEKKKKEHDEEEEKTRNKDQQRTAKKNDITDLVQETNTGKTLEEKTKASREEELARQQAVYEIAKSPIDRIQERMNDITSKRYLTHHDEEYLGLLYKGLNVMDDRGYASGHKLSQNEQEEINRLKGELKTTMKYGLPF